MLRQVRLFNGELFLDSAGRKFAVAKDFQDGYTGGVCKGLKNAGLIGPQLVLHVFSIFYLSNIRN